MLQIFFRKINQSQSFQLFKFSLINQTNALNFCAMCLVEEDMEQFEKEFEEQFSMAHNKEKFLYGTLETEETISAMEYIKRNPISSFIPKESIKKMLEKRVPKILYKDVSTSTNY